MALGSIGAAPGLAVPALIGALGDEEKSCRAQAAEALGKFGSRAKDCVPALIKLLSSGYGDQLISSAALGALVSIGAEAVRLLAEVVRSGDSEGRRFAAMALEAFGAQGKAALRALIAALGDEDRNVVRQAIRSVGAMGKEASPAVATLVGIYRGEESSEVRALAAEALGRIGPAAAEAVPLLLPALGDESGALRAEAALALGRIGAESQRAVPLLRGLLEDGRLFVRCLAALALLDYGAERVEALKTLDNAFQDPQFHERYQVLWKLEGHPSETRYILEHLIALLKERDNTLRVILPLLAGMGPEARAAVPALQKLLKDREGSSRLWPDPFTLPRKDPIEDAAREVLRKIDPGAGKESP